MKNKPWVRRRHQIIQTIALPFFKLVLRCKIKFKYDKMRITRKSPMIVLYNHQTLYDQFFCSMSFRGPLYHVATEDITSNGFVSKLLKFGVNVIPFKKSTNDINAVKICFKVIKEGGSIALSPEGNRTYSGITCNIKPSIVKLIKKLKVPVAFYKITGGYGALPRWAEAPRKGLVNFNISRILQYEEYKDMSNEDFYELVKNELYVDEREIHDTYKSKKNAECLERAIYVCPKCGISEFISSGNKFICKHCGLETEYLENKTFKDNYPFNNVTEWYMYQSDFINNLDLNEFKDNVIFENKAKLIEVVPYSKKKCIYEECLVKSYNDHLTIIDAKNNENVFKVDYKDLMAMSVLGKNKFNFYYNDKIYQVKSDIHFNALKYVNIYYRYVNMNNLEVEEEMNDSRKFLGL